MFKSKLLAAVAALTLASGAASAATFDGRLSAEGGGTAQIYDLGGGEYLGLIGLIGAGVGDDVSLAAINSRVVGGGLSAIYVATPGIDNFGSGLSAFQDISSGVSVGSVDRASDGRIFDAIWMRFSGSIVNFTRNTGSGSQGNLSIAGANVLAGNPLAPVPLPAALPLLLAGLGGLALVARRRRKIA